MFFLQRIVTILFPLLVLAFALSGCASSNVSRDTATNVDLGIRNAKKLFYNAADSDFAEAYQNSSQALKGALIGGAAGAIIGAVANPVGALAGAAIGIVVGGSYGMYIDTNAGLRDRIINRGGNIVILGDQILIMIPSARIFNPMTPIIKREAYSTLDLISRFINRYTKMLVKIAVYTSPSSSCAVDLALSRQEANAIARYFTAQGMDARLIYAVGYGGAHPIVNTAWGWEESDNYRIEITLEKLYV